MLTTFFPEDAAPPSAPQEGDLYKRITIAGRTFELYYGYYEEFERHTENSEPMPIYPDFTKDPLYTDDGTPFVTAMQDVCRHYQGEKNGDGCSDCTHFRKCEELFGLCTCPQNRRPPNG